MYELVLALLAFLFLVLWLTKTTTTSAASSAERTVSLDFSAWDSDNPGDVYQNCQSFAVQSTDRTIKVMTSNWTGSGVTMFRFKWNPQDDAENQWQKSAAAWVLDANTRDTTTKQNYQLSSGNNLLDTILVQGGDHFTSDTEFYISFSQDPTTLTSGNKTLQFCLLAGG